MLPATSELPFAVLLLVGGVLSCFLGQRLFRTVLAIYGFVLGALVATSVMGDAGRWVVVGVALAGGIVGALILTLAYFMAVALVGAALAVAALHLGWAMVSGEPHWGIVLGVAVVGALAALVVQRYVIVTGTAFGGAWLLLVGGLMVMGRVSARAASRGAEAWLVYPLTPSPERKWMIAAWLAIGVLGVLVQLSLIGRSQRKKTSFKRSWQA